MKKLPIIYLTIDDDDEAGVDSIALVDEPAIERHWMAFSKQPKRHTFEITNVEKRVISGPLMIADFPIYRRDEEGNEYYVVFDSDTIRKIVYKFMKEGRTNSVNEMHETYIDGVFMFESFIIDKNKRTPEGFEELTDGSWFGSFKVENDEVWEQVKDGTFKGYSVEGLFKEDRQMIIDEEIIDAVVASIKR